MLEELSVSLIEQTLVSKPLRDVEAQTRREVAAVLATISPKARSASAARPVVAVGCSSRGISNYARIVRAVVDELELRGFEPFLFPAMGSHGSSTAEGQLRVLARAGIDETSMGCPIRSSLEVVTVGHLDSGTPVVVDSNAAAADGIVVVNRVKSHTEFTHPFESGLMKMLSIGVGKEAGASLYHREFLRSGYGPTIEGIVEVVRSAVPVYFGVGIVEDGYAQTSAVRALPDELLLEGEAELLTEAISLMPRLPFDDIDVLVIDEMGKDISGAGFDTKVVGRLSMPLLGPDPASPRVKRIVVCSLTEASEGNADGVGIADFITTRLRDAIDMNALYVNALAGSEPEHARIPMTMASDALAVDAAIATIGPVSADTVRLVHIRNTRDLALMEVSQALTDECADHTDVRVLGTPKPLSFSTDGHLLPWHAGG